MERGGGEKRSHEGPHKSFDGETNSSSRAYHARHTMENAYSNHFGCEIPAIQTCLRY